MYLIPQAGQQGFLGDTLGLAVASPCLILVTEILNFSGSGSSDEAALSYIHPKLPDPYDKEAFNFLVNEPSLASNMLVITPNINQEALWVMVLS
jgi:hypothetical protein